MDETPNDAVTTTVDVDADVDEVWTLLTDDDERATWFGGPTELDASPGGRGHFTDPDGTRREAVVETVETERRLGWTWWPATDPDPARRSHVDVELVPCETGTRVTVTERPLSPVARLATADPNRSGARSARSGVHFEHQLAALEIECVLRRVLVPAAVCG